MTPHIRSMVLVLGMGGLLAGRALPRAQDSGDLWFPPRGPWPMVEAGSVGMDSGLLADAVRLAIDAEAATPEDLREYISRTLANEPHGEIVGPVRDRGPASGVVIRGGHAVASWGDPDRVDMTFSVTKTYLSTVVGMAHDGGLIPTWVHRSWRPFRPVTSRGRPRPSRGSICSARPAAGQGRCGGSRTGRIDPLAELRLQTLPVFRGTPLARAGSTTTFG